MRMANNIKINTSFSDETDLLQSVEQSRAKSYSDLDGKQRSKKGQFGTPDSVAKLMASMFSMKTPEIRLLDAGAGVGSLTAAFVMEACNRQSRPKSIHAVLFEDDQTLCQVLSDNMELCKKFCNERDVLFSFQVISEDFIEYIVDSQSSLFCENNVDLNFNCAIQNPPYKKIRSDSNHRRLLRRLGVEVSNLYAAFVSLTIRLLAPNGELVAITPRSFCNGPYFKSFRSDFLRRASLQRIHVFDSRSEAFGGDGVLQENVITYSITGVANPDTVQITSSSGSPDADETSRFVKYETVVPAGDAVPFIHLITDGDSQLTVERMGHFESTLDTLSVEVSTGRVVDFRAKEFLRQMPKNGDAPLIYPMHLRRDGIEWPIADSKKPNAIAVEEGSKPQLVPEGIYVLVKRFSSKEQRRRIEAFVFDSEEVLPSSPIGFENHLNYFHHSGGGLQRDFAQGLACYLNSTLVDQYFRLFSGHTQVNATDLRNLPYPTRKELEHLGSQICDKVMFQDEIDSIFSEKFFGDNESANPNDGNPVASLKKITQAKEILKQLGFSKTLLNTRSTLTLLALLDLAPTRTWAECSNPVVSVTEILEHFSVYYGKDYHPKTIKRIERETLPHFLDAGIIQVVGESQTSKTSEEKGYQILPETLKAFKTFGIGTWDDSNSSLSPKESMQLLEMIKSSKKQPKLGMTL